MEELADAVIKPGNPTFWQGLNVRSIRNYYIVSIPRHAGKIFLLYLGEVCFHYTYRDQDLKPFLASPLKATGMQDIDSKLVQIR